MSKTEEVKTLGLGLFRVQFKLIGETPETPLPENSLVEDFGTPLTEILPWAPSYFIKGWFTNINHMAKVQFIIDPEGPNTMYFSKQLDKRDVDHSKSILPNTLYKEAWKDELNNTYILQIV